MILEHSINQRKNIIKPTIKFNYISPSTLQKVHSLANCRPTIFKQYQPLIKSQPYAQNYNKDHQSLQNFRKSQRKKIFDRTYTTKGSFFRNSSREKSLEFERQKIKSISNNLNRSLKKERKAIFSKIKKMPPLNNDEDQFKIAPIYYRSNQTSTMKIKPPSSLTSYIDIDALRKQFKPRHQFNLNSHNEYSHPFLVDKYENEDHEDNLQGINSEVKVDISVSSDTNKSIDYSNTDHRGLTDSRFFDKELNHNPPKKHEKLSEVALYSTINNGNFGKILTPEPLSIIENIKKSLLSFHLKSSYLPYLLIVMGLFLFLVQASN